MSEAELQRSPGSLASAANVAFLMMVALLPWMKHGFTVGGLSVFPTDLIFVVAFALWCAALVTRQMQLRLHPAFILLALYFAAMGLSVTASSNPWSSAFKLLTQVYLLMLPVMAFNFVTTANEARRLFRWWLIPAILVGLYGAITMLLFPFFGWHSFLREPLHNFGTLPHGTYPRIELTFEYPAMLANYLGVSLMLLLLGRMMKWVTPTQAYVGGGLLALSAFFALTPGFGGLFATVAAWFAYREWSERPMLSRFAIAAALAAILLEVLVSAITPIIHPTAPYLIHIPGVAAPWAPGIRLMVWTAGLHNFLASPLIGHGIGIDPVSVMYQTPWDPVASPVTDAHNVFLSIAVQCGVIGLAALCAIIGWAVRTARSATPSSPANALLFGLAVAWVGSFVVQGLVGAFEDARHLWLLFGLVLAASRLDRSTTDQA